ncbi:MAG: aminotransferase class I/II-fold pyridoxal phosphate-dependent enzyme [Clostridia bacterium]|nr:aminotransferase class I/II-fold pyridoxal phosphate-dependent enzyme [Clostridia bacterium]
MKLSDMNKSQLEAMYSEVCAQYDEFKSRGLKLDMSRGKPAADQLNMSNEILNCLSADECKSRSGLDCRNYGVGDGLPEMKELFAELFEMPVENVIVGGNSSLNMMFDCIAQGVSMGFGNGPWAKLDKVKFLCPAPGYDRHFGVTEYFGFELITVDMLPTGPDMDQVEELVKNDASIKGIWCVPKYSNPTGITFSDETVKRLAAMKPAAPDFKIFWDNAYMIHHLNDNNDQLLNIMEEAKKCGNENNIIMFTSTSKITFPGNGIAAMAASDDMIKMLKKRLNYQTIGPDKINQLRHLKLFPNVCELKKHMKRHAEILAPKFDAVIEALTTQLGDLGVIEWTNPNGGYFIGVDLLEGCAKRTAQLCAEGGVVLTPAGATFPYGNDPKDRNIRLSPSFPPVAELKTAMELFCICVKMASLEKYLGK